MIRQNGYTIPMKKRRSFPDFRQLGSPEPDHKTDLLSLEIFFFFLCAGSGFLWEVFLMYAQGWDYVNRGFFYGPWLPVYGAGGVLFHLLLARKAASCSSPFLRIPVVFVLSALLGTGVELFTGWLLDSLWHLRYWDYSAYPFHFHGYICLWSAIGFGCAGVLWICLIAPHAARLWFRISAKWRRSLNTILLLLFVLDCAAALIFPNTGKGITSFSCQDNTPSPPGVLQTAPAFSDSGSQNGADGSDTPAPL